MVGGVGGGFGRVGSWSWFVEAVQGEEAVALLALEDVGQGGVH